MALAVTPVVHAQTAAVDESPPDKFIFGPLGLTPRIALRNVGLDTNPLNLPGETERDVTATLEPGLNSSLRIGRGRITGKTTLEWLYFADSSTQRSLNLSQEARAEVAMNRVRPYVFGQLLRTRQRPTPEIDLRVQQHATNAGVGTSLLLGSRFRFDLEGRRSTVAFDEGEHGSVAVANELNRDSDGVALTARMILTPLTTFVVRSEVQHDRFAFSAVRDNNSLSVVPGFELKPAALISGSVFVGFRRFDAVQPNVPDYTGLVGRIEALYLWREATLFSFGADRDVIYSIEPDQPYYLQTGGRLAATQMLGLNWYLVGRIGETRLAYRDLMALTGGGLDSSRTDRVLTRGGGIGRRLGEDLRIGFDVDYVRRRSSLVAATYDGYRIGGSISYGSPTR